MYGKHFLDFITILKELNNFYAAPATSASTPYLRQDFFLHKLRLLCFGQVGIIVNINLFNLKVNPCNFLNLYIRVKL
jgi:hypothetical protein